MSEEVVEGGFHTFTDMTCASCDPSAAESQKVANLIPLGGEIRIMAALLVHQCTFKYVTILNTKNCHTYAIINLGCLFTGRVPLMSILTGKVIISISGIKSIRYLKQS